MFTKLNQAKILVYVLFSVIFHKLYFSMYADFISVSIGKTTDLVFNHLQSMPSLYNVFPAPLPLSGIIRIWLYLPISFYFYLFFSKIFLMNEVFKDDEKIKKCILLFLYFYITIICFVFDWYWFAIPAFLIIAYEKCNKAILPSLLYWGLIKDPEPATVFLICAIIILFDLILVERLTPYKNNIIYKMFLFLLNALNVLTIMVLARVLYLISF